MSKNLPIFFLLGWGSNCLLPCDQLTCPLQPELRAGTWVGLGRQEQDIPLWVAGGEGGRLASPRGRGQSTDTKEATSPRSPGCPVRYTAPGSFTRLSFFQTRLSMGLSPRGVTTLNPCSTGAAQVGFTESTPSRSVSTALSSTIPAQT